jgi:hypothetical protein
LSCGDASSCTIICADTCNWPITCDAPSCEVYCQGQACTNGRRLLRRMPV